MVNTENKKYKLLKWWNLIIIDTLALAVVLCSFCYFHHVRYMWGGSDDKGVVSASTVGKFTRPPTTTAPLTTTTSVTTTSAATGSESITTGNIGDDTPQHVIDYGQFGAAFPDVFAKEGEVVSNDNLYKSHDVSIAYNKVVETRFKRQITYYYFDIYIRNIDNIYTLTSESKVDFSVMEQSALDMSNIDALPVLLTNGDQWRYNGEPSASLKIANGAIIRQKAIKNITQGVCVLYFDGTMEIIHPDSGSFDFASLSEKGVYQSWSFGPWLIDDNGNAMSESALFDLVGTGKSFSGYRARTAIGYFEPGHYCLVVLEDGWDNTNAVSIPELAVLMDELGCEVAYNLDGGASSCCSFNGQYLRKGDPGKTRQVTDLICVGEAKVQK